MPINSKLIRHKQRQIRVVAKDNDAYGFFNLLTEPDMLSKVEE